MPATETASYSERQQTEARFHDAWAEAVDVSDIDPRVAFEAETALENRLILARIGSLQGLRVLDLGCGAGEAAVYFALQGAHVCACDISPQFVALARQLAQVHGVAIRADVCPAECLPYDDGAFDVIYANGVLHHVDIPATLPEVRRVLAAGGRGFFIEPLPYNPLINLYRWIAREVRTPDERPLNRADCQAIRAVFARMRIEYAWFFTLAVFVYFFVVERASTSERYWKKIVYQADRYAWLFRPLRALDNWLLPRLPMLGPLCWNMIIQVQREPGELAA